MSGRVRGVAGHEQRAVSEWEACATPAGALDGPDALEKARPTFVSARAPTTAAAALRESGAFSLDGPARRFDSEDWWFRARVPALDGEEKILALDGIATIAEVWLDGERILESDNMFLAHRLEKSGRELVICCRALDLAKRRPRPRWRVPMVEQQQLRWFRTTLLGRTPGWSPPAPAVGPWRPVRVEAHNGFAVDDVKLRTRWQGGVGIVEVSASLRALSQAPKNVELIVGDAHRVALDGNFSGRLELREPARWWPHTHGEPALYDARLEVDGRAVSLGRIGFRTVERDGDFSLRWNDVPLFCRGACWTPLDPLTLSSDRDSLRRALLQARDAGMNMLRVGGTMVYESDAFHDLCDELGILVWQDFMFANFDYPDELTENVQREARQQLARWQARPSLAVLCGNSEGEQQAAMWGAPRELWAPKLFHEVLAKESQAACPDVPYWPSSAHGGAFPHQASTGTTSYYGVGAYLRPLEDARRSELRFATECLAFANLPERVSPTVRVHHPAWKARTPRDLGAGWDFDDVRDHYLASLYRVDPEALRYSDHDRYLQLGRVATGEVMAQAFGEWRRQRSRCRGALVWFLRDLWAGAGWGVVDADGRPKAAYYHLKRALQPISVHLSDEGLNGVAIHVCNERPEPLAGELELSRYRAGEVLVGRATRPITVAARETVELDAAEWMEGFVDVTWAYRFGPPSHDLLVATLNGGVAQAFHFPVGLPNARELDLGLTASVSGELLTVKTRRFAQSIAIDVDGFVPEDSYFHLAPGQERTIRLSGEGVPRGTVQPLNAETATRIA